MLKNNSASDRSKKRFGSIIKRYWQLILVCLISTFGVIYFTPSIATTAVTTNSVLLGIANEIDTENNLPSIQAMESWQGKKHAVVNVFASWCDRPGTKEYIFSQLLPSIWNHQNVPMITWEPFICTKSLKPTDAEARAETPADIEIRIANGEFDTYINAWAEQMKIFLSGVDGKFNTPDDRRAYIRFAHEMNGNWYPWSPLPGVNPASDYIRMWQRVKSIFYDEGMGWTHLQWVWSPNHSDTGGYSAEQLYPGDNYVDWVGLSGYNWGATQFWSRWVEAQYILEEMINRLQALTTRPVAITEFASTNTTKSGISLAAKSQWITDAYNFAVAKNVRMIIWFNSAKETDWSVFGGPSGDSTFNYNSKTYNAYSAYKAAVSTSNFVSSDPTNPRLLSEAKFIGF